MWQDPIVEEVRKARAELGARFNHDLRALCEYLKQQEQLHKDRLVSFPPKRIKVEESATSR